MDSHFLHDKEGEYPHIQDSLKTYTIFVGWLRRGISKEEITEAFSHIGPVRRVTPIDSKQETHALVVFEDRTSVRETLKQIHMGSEFSLVLKKLGPPRRPPTVRASNLDSCISIEPDSGQVINRLYKSEFLKHMKTHYPSNPFTLLEHDSRLYVEFSTREEAEMIGRALAKKYKSRWAEEKRPRGDINSPLYFPPSSLPSIPTKMQRRGSTTSSSSHQGYEGILRSPKRFTRSPRAQYHPKSPHASSSTSTTSSSSTSSPHMTRRQDPHRETKDASRRTVFVSGFNPNLDEQDLYCYFRRCGSIERVVKRTSVRSRRLIAYILYSSIASATTACNELNGMFLLDRVITAKRSASAPPVQSVRDTPLNHTSSSSPRICQVFGFKSRKRTSVLKEICSMLPLELRRMVCGGDVCGLSDPIVEKFTSSSSSTSSASLPLGRLCAYVRFSKSEGARAACGIWCGRGLEEIETEDKTHSPTSTRSYPPSFFSYVVDSVEAEDCVQKTEVSSLWVETNLVTKEEKKREKERQKQKEKEEEERKKEAKRREEELKMQKELGQYLSQEDESNDSVPIYCLKKRRETKEQYPVVESSSATHIEADEDCVDDNISQHHVQEKEPHREPNREDDTKNADQFQPFSIGMSFPFDQDESQDDEDVSIDGRSRNDEDDGFGETTKQSTDEGSSGERIDTPPVFSFFSAPDLNHMAPISRNGSNPLIPSFALPPSLPSLSCPPPLSVSSVPGACCIPALGDVDHSLPPAFLLSTPSSAPSSSSLPLLSSIPTSLLSRQAGEDKTKHSSDSTLFSVLDVCTCGARDMGKHTQHERNCPMFCVELTEREGLDSVSQTTSEEPLLSQRFHSLQVFSSDMDPSATLTVSGFPIHMGDIPVINCCLSVLSGCQCPHRIEVWRYPLPVVFICFHLEEHALEALDIFKDKPILFDSSFGSALILKEYIDRREFLK
eukprot:gnl/Carplike_NY0171/1805_a2445_805.p1 GENE.gnl/Carplike_NY0171/1805_a2445_805~~gnl/Carplike_NY0171/1805_a2445_805.p1  ORF type:complete len:953 (-),score=249.39 gnl/Carplike_NY0171/1805_a2445_805:64-2922(-)